MQLTRLVRLAHRFQSSRIGRICGWTSFIVMGWMDIGMLGNLVLRRYTGEQFDLTDGLLLVVAFFAANAAWTMYVTYIRPSRSRDTEEK
jgi:hypothetical protein